jgi:hypothetical protein
MEKFLVGFLGFAWCGICFLLKVDFGLLATGWDLDFPARVESSRAEMSGVLDTRYSPFPSEGPSFRVLTRVWEYQHIH